MLPILTARVLIKALLRAGFRIVRQKGSHVHLEHILDSSRVTQVAIHASRTIPRGTLSAILRQAKISVTELLTILKRSK